MNMCRDPELVKRIGAATALEVRATGIPYVFAPCVAVVNFNNGCFMIAGDLLSSKTFMCGTLYIGLQRSEMGSVFRELR